jgi:hypothetical protein
MNGAQWHLLINHLPVFGLVFGLLVQLASLIRKSEELKRAALALFLVTALGTIPAYITGDPAEHVVQDMPDVNRDQIDSHSDWATASLVAIEALGAAALAGLYLAGKSGTVSALAFNGCLALAIVGFGLVAWTAHLGGLIHHPEIRPGFVVPPRPPGMRRQSSE